MSLVYYNLEEHLVDIFTKPLSAKKFEIFRQRLEFATPNARSVDYMHQDHKFSF